jgi:hypothetical protein
MRVTQATITVGNVTTAVLTANQKRRHLLLQNDSDEVIYVAFGKAAALNAGIRLAAAGGQYEMYGDLVYGHAINAICTSGNKKLLVTSGV